MNRDFRLFFFAIVIPTLLLSAAGLRLVQIELHAARRPAPPFERRMDGGRPPPLSLKPDEGERVKRRPPPPPPPHWRRPIRMFSEENAVVGERVVWIGGCFFSVMLLSLITGGWLLARAAKKARDEAREKVEFIGQISHAFKTPLTTICLCSEWAQDEGLSQERRQKALTAIAEAAEKLRHIVAVGIDMSGLAETGVTPQPKDGGS